MGSIRVLWVDPDDQIYERWASALVKPGWQVSRAYTFLDALELVMNAAYDLAIIELQLPDAIGTDVWHYIKKLHPGIRGILMTASVSLHSLIYVYEPDILAYVFKPLGMPDLCELIDQIAAN